MNDELEDQKDTLVTKNDIKRLEIKNILEFSYRNLIATYIIRKKDLDQIEKDRKENAQREAEIKRLENIEMEKRYLNNIKFFIFEKKKNRRTLGRNKKE